MKVLIFSHFVSEEMNHGTDVPITEHLCFVLGTFGNMIIYSRGHSFSHFLKRSEDMRDTITLSQEKSKGL